MTLLEMIKKYEKIKKEMKRKYAEEDEFVVDCILKDLNSIEEQQPSLHTIKQKVIEKMSTALDDTHFHDAHTLSDILAMLCTEV